MNMENVRERLLQLRGMRPFRPFTIQLTNDRIFQIASPEFIMIGHEISVVQVTDHEGMERIVTVQHCNIATVEEYDRVQSPGAR